MNYQKVYQQRLGAMTKSILGNKIKEEIEIKSIGDAKLTHLYEDMEQIVAKSSQNQSYKLQSEFSSICKHVCLLSS